MSHPKHGIYPASWSTLLFLPGMLVALIATFVAWYVSATAYKSAFQLVLHTQETINEIDRLSFLARETGYFPGGSPIIDNSRFLQRSNEIRRRELLDSIDRLLALTGDSTRQQQRVALLRTLSADGISISADSNPKILGPENRNDPGPATADAAADNHLWETLKVTAEMADEEKELLATRSAGARELARRAEGIVLLVIGLCCVCVCLTLIAFQKDSQRRKSVEKELEITNSQLQQTISDLQLTGSVTHSLQACVSLEEVNEVIKAAARRLFPNTKGALAIITESHNTAEVVGHWGGETGMEPVFSPEACIALRTGHATTFSSKEVGLACRHFTFTPVSSACLPITAHGETIGILHLSSTDLSVPLPGDLATRIVEQIALGLANLLLRDSLWVKSTRDSLTGLFNRRYMEEALEREVARANRTGSKLAAVMIDLDHFKRFNDSNGHGAGDAVLRKVGLLLRSVSRLQDIACRYVGEEMVVILPEIGAEGAGECAERWRQAIAQLQVCVSGQLVGCVTASFGVAEFRKNMTGEQLLRAADQSLYHAKEKGRDRVELYSDVIRSGLEEEVESLVQP